MNNQPAIVNQTQTLPSQHLHKSLQDKYKDEYPIIYYEPNLDLKETESFKKIIQNNPQIFCFSNFEEASEQPGHRLYHNYFN